MQPASASGPHTASARSADAAFELLLFGAPRVVRRGAVLHTGSRKALTILALLALEGPCTRERLAQWMWPEAEAGAARRNLRRDLFRLRELDLPLREHADGHLGLGDGWQVDVLAFRRALADGDEATALRHGGPAVFEGLDGVAGIEVDQWLAEQRAALARLRQRAQLALARLRADRGDADSALALWTQALEEDPCHEAALLPAMTLLSQRGERAAALALYEATRTALRQRLDAEPAESVQALADRLRAAASGSLPGKAPTVIRVDPPPPEAAPEATADAAPVLPAGERVPFVGRSALLAQVQAAWDSGQRVVLSGVSGVGKTRLACACAAHAGAWIRLNCGPLDAAEPFCTAVNALRALMQAAPDLALPRWVQRELAQLMPEFGPAPEHTPNAAQAQRLHEAFGEALGLLASDNFDAVVVDDWQWCDADSRVMLDLLGRQSRLRCVFTFRAGELPADAQQRLQREIDDGTTRQIEVTGLSAEDTLSLVRAVAPVPDEAVLAQRLHGATQGHPLHLLETLRHLGHRARRQADGATLPLPPSVRETVLARVRAQGEDTRKLLEAASLLGGDFAHHWLEGLIDGGPDRVVESLERAEAARLVAPQGGLYRFDHDLLRQCVADSLSPARRQRLHQQLAERLADSGAVPARVALQFEQAGLHRRAVPWRLRAGADALQRHAVAEATRHYRQALADQPEPASAVAAHLALLDVYRRTGDAAAANDAVAEAVGVAAQADPATQLEARLTCAEHWAARERGADALNLLAGLAGELAGAGPLAQARALACSAAVHSRAGRYREAQEHYPKAVALLEQSPAGLPRLGKLLLNYAVNALYLADPASAETLSRRACTAYEATGDQGGMAETTALLAVARIHQGDSGPDTWALLQRAREIAAHCGNVPAQRMALANLITLASGEGDTAQQQALIEEAFALAPGFESPGAEFNFLLYRAQLHWSLGEVGPCETVVKQAMEVVRGIEDLRLRLLILFRQVEICLFGDRLAEAEQHLQHAEEALAGTDGEQVQAELPRLRALVKLRAGRPHEAEAWWRRIPDARSNHEDHFTVPATGAEIALALGDVALARERLAAAPATDQAPIEAKVLVLVQQLAIARASGEPTTALEERAQALLASGRVPVPSATQLHNALGARPGPEQAAAERSRTDPRGA